MKALSFALLSTVTYTAIGCSSKLSEKQPSKVDSIIAPQLGMTLGRGYDPTHPNEPKGDCIANVNDAKTESWNDATGIVGSLTETRIRSWEQMQSELSLTANAAAESLWGNANASFSKFEKFRSDENSFTWLAKFVVESGEKTLDGSKAILTVAAQNLLNANRLSDFYKMCGTEYIRSIKLGGRIVVANEVSSQYKDIVKSITATVGGKATFGGFGFAGSAAFSSYFNDAFFKSVLTREIDQIGGSAIDITQLSPDNFSAYLNRFQNELKNLRQGKVIQIETASWDTLGVSNLGGLADWHRKQTLDELYKNYRLNVNSLNRISDFGFWKSEGKIAIAEETMSYLNRMKFQIEKQNTAIASRATKCMELNSCDASGFDYITVKFPAVESSPSQAREQFGNLRFSVRENVSNFGSTAEYDGETVRYYDIPVVELSDSNLKTARILVYETPCESAESWMKTSHDTLHARGVHTAGVIQYDHRLRALETNWFDGHLSRLVVFQKGTNGLCPILKATADGTGVTRWLNVPDFDSVIRDIERTLQN